jgi:uncharacterized protein (TIGR02453 family)
VNSPPFAGFPPEALAFYEGLAADNSKAFFDAHRETYEQAVREPLELLLYELSGEFGTGKVFRPYRDVRFSRDKSPYKLAGAAVLGGSPRSCYVEISAGGLRTGAGMWEPDRGQLERVRRAIDDERHGTELERVAARLPLHEPELKTAPRGFPRDHPRVELLRRKRFAALRTHAPAAWLHDRRALDRVVEDWRVVGPLLDWLDRHAGPPDPVEDARRRR